MQRSGVPPPAAPLEGVFGHTPLIRLRMSDELGVEIFAKCEFLNPGGSVKDRPALNMLLAAEASGALKPGGCIVEGSPGNTSVGLCAAGVARGYRCIFLAPDKVHEDNPRLQKLRRMGATVERCPTAGIVGSSPQHYQQLAAARAKEIEGAWHAWQFENRANYRAHELTTGPELWSQTNGRLDAVVVVCGTGGQAAGTSRSLKALSGGHTQAWVIESGLSGVIWEPHQLGQVVHEDPAVSPVAGIAPESEAPADIPEFEGLLHGRTATAAEKSAQGPNRGGGPNGSDGILEGIGAARAYVACRDARLDGALRGSDQLALEMAEYLARHEGLLVGPTGALSVVGAIWVAKKHLAPGARVACVLCDVASNVIWDAFAHIPRTRTTVADFVNAYDEGFCLTALAPKHKK